MVSPSEDDLLAGKAFDETLTRPPHCRSPGISAAGLSRRETIVKNLVEETIGRS